VNALVLTDMMPRFNTDYGHGTPIRTAGAYRIATVLKCPVIDYFFHLTFEKQKEVLDFYIDADTKIIGISLTNMRGHTKNFDQHSLFDKFNPIGSKSNSVIYFHEEAAKILVYIRETYPNAKIVIGGGQITNIKDQGLKFIDDYIDYVITGEGDIAVTQLDNPICYDKWDIGNKNYQFKNARVIHADKDYPVTKEYVSTIHIDNTYSHFLPGEWTFIEISRGCIFNCFFCSYRHTNKRRSTSSIRDELIKNYELYGTTRYRLLDDTFNDSKQKVEDICGMFIDLPFDIEWHSYARTDVLSTHPDLIDIMYESGCKYLKFGLESTNNTALKMANKNLSHAKANKVLEEIHRRTNGQLYTHSNFIIGLPGETPESQKKTFEWLKSCPLKTYSFTTWHRDKYHENMIDIKEMSEYGKEEFQIRGYGNDWIHETMSSTQAYELYNQAREDLRSIRGPYWIGSDMYPILRTYGIDHDDVDLYMDFTMDQDAGFKSWLESKFEDHVKTYYNKLGFTIELRNAMP
jgi:radical SAM superfamily enzyme YgiQ (UPF0313 family)